MNRGFLGENGKKLFFIKGIVCVKVLWDILNDIYVEFFWSSGLW